LNTLTCVDLNFCHQVAAWFPDIFSNFHLVKNHKIAKNSTTTLASLSSLVLRLWKRLGGYPRVVQLKGTSSFTRVGSGFTCKQETRKDMLTSDEHSSLLQKNTKIQTKKFYNIYPKLVKYFFLWHSGRILASSSGGQGFVKIGESVYFWEREITIR
jgi:hypothetical protein